jgi:hypothetical protein
VGISTVTITLQNWNDEVPIFTEELVTVAIDETALKGFPVATMTATDRDVDDKIV